MSSYSGRQAAPGVLNPDAVLQGTVTAYDSAGRVMAREPLIVTGT